MQAERLKSIRYGGDAKMNKKIYRRGACAHRRGTGESTGDRLGLNFFLFLQFFCISFCLC